MASLYPCPCIVPSQIDSGLGHRTCFDQLGISKLHTRKFLKSVCALGLAFSLAAFRTQLSCDKTKVAYGKHMAIIITNY